MALAAWWLDMGTNCASSSSYECEITMIEYGEVSKARLELP